MRTGIIKASSAEHERCVAPPKNGLVSVSTFSALATSATSLIIVLIELITRRLASSPRGPCNWLYCASVLYSSDGNKYNSVDPGMTKADLPALKALQDCFTETSNSSGSTVDVPAIC